MKVFISWSGTRSHEVAKLLDRWIKCVLQAVDPWLSSRDIDRGSLWFTQISDQLANTSVGIVCLTQENKNNPWILFESGALAKGISSNKVCTFLIDLKPNEIKDPLAQFNHTEFDRESVFQLIRTINFSLGDRSLKEDILDEVFGTYWPKFESQFNSILEIHPSYTQVEPRAESDKIDEVLSIIRGVEKRIRNLEFSEGKVPDTSSLLDLNKYDGVIPTNELIRKANSIAEWAKSTGLNQDQAISTLKNQGVPRTFARAAVLAVYRQGESSKDSQ